MEQRIVKLFQRRLAVLNSIAEKGVIPGELDTYELEQLIGRIKELTFIINLLTGNDTAQALP